MIVLDASAVVALLLSIPWVAADLGFYLPEGVFIMERPGLEPDGTTIAAVHLGHHHGLDGTLIVLSALLVSRPRLHATRLGLVAQGYVSLALAYGAANLVEDAWHEQLVKRDWIDWKIPSALRPSLAAIWLVVGALAVATALVLRRERSADVDSPA